MSTAFALSRTVKRKGFRYFLLFRYVPMYGVLIAFKDYDIFGGV
jgi:ABC-type polysaccharide transport system permease subunit